MGAIVKWSKNRKAIGWKWVFYVKLDGQETVERFKNALLLSKISWHWLLRNLNLHHYEAHAHRLACAANHVTDRQKERQKINTLQYASVELHCTRHALTITSSTCCKQNNAQCIRKAGAIRMPICSGIQLGVVSACYTLQFLPARFRQFPWSVVLSYCNTRSYKDWKIGAAISNNLKNRQLLGHVNPQRTIHIMGMTHFTRFEERPWQLPWLASCHLHARVGLFVAWQLVRWRGHHYLWTILNPEK